MSAAAWSRPYVALLVLVVAGATSLHAQDTVRGRLHHVWDGGAEDGVARYVVRSDGTSVRVVSSPSDSPELLAADRLPVEVRGTPAPSDGGQAMVARSIRPDLTVGLRQPSDAVRETYDFVTVLCRFADDPPPAFGPAEVERVHGTEYPGVRHFFRELSWDAGLMSRSRVTDWVKLPHPRSRYVLGPLTDLGALARDCTSAAQTLVDFRDFYGINLQFSSGLARRLVAPFDTFSYGGSWTLTLNGETRTWGMTWLSAGHATDYAVLAHEMGHALGWPHSSGEYGSEFDSEWDVMSRGFLRWEPPYGWLGVHTIAHHKEAAGWVAPERLWSPANGTIESGLITRTAHPSAKGYLMARIPAGDGVHYTAEARLMAGHDQPLPGEAVVLHRVQHRRAFVVDAEGNGDPNGAGAQWLPGEEFQDSTSGFSLRVDSAAAEGFHVTITRGWRLDVEIRGPGRVTTSAGPERCDSACSIVRSARGDLVALEAVPSAGFRFLRWEGACSGSKAHCSVALKANRAVTAVFGPVAASAGDSARALPMGAPVTIDLGAVHGAGAVEWVLLSDSLPPGIVLDPSSGVISGIPAAVGRFTVEVAARSAHGDAVHTVVMDVVHPELSLEAVLGHYFGAQPLSADEARYLDLLGNRNGRVDIGDVRRWLGVAPGLNSAERARAGALLTGGRSD